MLVQTGTAAAEDDLGAERTPPDRRVPERPVFVDASGRRQRRVRRIGWVLVVPAVAYVGMLASTLLGGPTINSPFLPLPAGPHAPGDGASGSAAPHVSSGTAGGPSAGASGGAVTTTRTGATGTGSKTGPGSTATAAGPSALPSVTTSPSAVVTHGRSTHTATSSPGVSHRPTKKATATP